MLPAPSTSSGPDAPPIALEADRLVRLALAAVLLLNVANLLNVAEPDWADGWLLMAYERNPSTWWSGAQLAAAAGLAWAIGRATAAPGKERRNWNVLAGALCFMSIDEVGTVHERLDALPLLPQVGSRLWLAAAVLLAAAVAYRLLPFVLGLPAPLRTAVLGGGAVFMLGAIGFEHLAGEWAHAGHGEDTTFLVISSIEENLELLGVLWVLAGLARHARRAGVALYLAVA